MQRRPGLGRTSAGRRPDVAGALVKLPILKKNIVIYVVLGPNYERIFAAPLVTKSLECQK